MMRMPADWLLAAGAATPDHVIEPQLSDLLS